MRLILSTLKILLSCCFPFSQQPIFHTNNMLLTKSHVTHTPLQCLARADVVLAESPVGRIHLGSGHCFLTSQASLVPALRLHLAWPRWKAQCNHLWGHSHNSTKSQQAISPGLPAAGVVSRRMKTAAWINGELQTAAGSALLYTAWRTRPQWCWPKDAVWFFTKAQGAGLPEECQAVLAPLGLRWTLLCLLPRGFAGNVCLPSDIRWLLS